LLARVVRRSGRQAAADDLGLNPSAAPIGFDDEAPDRAGEKRTAGARRRARVGREARRAAEAQRREKAAREAKIHDLEAQRAEAESAQRDAQMAHEAERERLLARLSAAERWRREAEAARHAAVSEIEARLRAAESARDDAEERAAAEAEALEAALRKSEDARHRAESTLTEAERANDAARQVYTAQLQAKVDETTRRLAEQRQEAERAAARAAAEAANYENRIAELQMVGETDGDQRDAAGRLELNTASVEGLRDLGLSITQAARLVSRREAVGGFGSVDDLQSVPGMPPEHLATLLESAYVDPALGPDSR
jgi:DNA uptake protein ComE-like DNA-binding protein